MRLKSIKQDVRILINIHLLCDICRISIIVFKGITERFGIIVFFITVFKVHEHFLNLVKYILLWFYCTWRKVISICDWVSKVWNNEQLLIKAIHVANTSKILESNISCWWFWFVIQGNSPILEPFASPVSTFMHLSQIR